MIALIQRVKEARVNVDQQVIANISQGLLVFVGIEKHDDKSQIPRLVERLLGYRIFADENDKMNLSIQDVNGDLLLVPQFTLAATTDKGLRPSFASSAAPNVAEELFNAFIAHAKSHYQRIATGRFGADMQVSLINDGPVTFWLQQ
ncbi:MAG TPA: D-tyrosyl-tRNA(Tyr) deacylase [Methylophaga aminisulfidivorans]|uniref:D-aminoacyl-tRNA deacylase n=2 Tax=root TaxID=1 RepID=A0A7C1ZRD9_9GAMM|nr:D-tyrosyl-tRNA(Tyr) deacylase [Methylophaga aminisulfidivorans]